MHPFQHWNWNYLKLLKITEVYRHLHPVFLSLCTWLLCWQSLPTRSLQFQAAGGSPWAFQVAWPAPSSVEAASAWAVRAWTSAPLPGVAIPRPEGSSARILWRLPAAPGAAELQRWFGERLLGGERQWSPEDAHLSEAMEPLLLTPVRWNLASNAVARPEAPGISCCWAHHPVASHQWNWKVRPPFPTNFLEALEGTSLFCLLKLADDWDVH